MALAAVIFDFFGTLTESVHRDERDAGHAQVAAALGVPADRFRDELHRSWPERACGRYGDVEATLRRIARDCGAEPDERQVQHAAAVRRAGQRSYLRLRAETVPTLQALRRRGLAIGLVSDCTHELVEEWPALPTARLVDQAVFSVVEGVKKPDPEIFGRVCTRLGVAPEDCLYVGDGDSRELPGAAAVGMRPVRLAAPDHRDGHVFEPVDWDGPSVSALTELLTELLPHVE